MSSSSKVLKKQLQELVERKRKAAEAAAAEEEALRIAIEEQERREEELRIEEERKEKARREAEERRLEEMRVLAEKEAAELAQTSRMVDVNMSEDSEWGRLSPYSTSMVMLPFLEEASRAEGPRRAWSRSVVTGRSQGSRRKGMTFFFSLGESDSKESERSCDRRFVRDNSEETSSSSP